MEVVSIPAPNSSHLATITVADVDRFLGKPHIMLSDTWVDFAIV